MMERELKLTAPNKKTLDAILDSELVQSACVSDANAPALQFTAIYYDSENLQLEKCLCGLRVRQEGDQLRAAMKLPGQIVDGLSERVEYEADLLRWPTSFQDFPRGDLLIALSERIDLNAVMVERVKVSMERRIRHLEFAATKVELAADHGMIAGLKGQQQLYEIELELKAGDVAPILKLGQELKKQFGLEFSVKTKLGIGLSLC